ncbi:DUF2085 domain-containing protein [Halorarum halophilum]|uniref:DUF2085 domain-containing protein n=1 Tax=Halorarum halophilum TaxID=2743090 RepID=A0A7D5K6I3_9EURY|nr:DUF2085 domain-containing protein [Halobaculum halophilum]QLG26739.1 DUF2085 domain-containing protein [Halobaculum halophilum]
MGRAWTGRLREVRRGLRAAAPFLLSHHLPGERDRCHTVDVAGNELHLCARCTGIYPGIAAALIVVSNGIAVPLAAVAALPAPALLEWLSTGRGDRPGRNDVRTLTGLALGLGYGFGLVRLLTDQNRFGVVAVGVAYATLAGVLLYGSGNRDADTN